MLEILMILLKTGVIGGTVGGVSYGLYRGIQKVGLHWIDKAGTQLIRGVSKLVGVAFTLLGKTVKTVGKGLAKGGKVALKGSKVGISRISENRRLKKAEKAYRDGLLNEDAFLDAVRNKGSKNDNRNASYRQNRGINQNNYPYRNNSYNNQGNMYSNSSNAGNEFEKVTLSLSCLKFIEAKCKEMNVSPLYYDSINKECCNVKYARAQRREKFTQGDVINVIKSYIPKNEEIKKNPVRKINISKVKPSIPKEDVMTISINTKDKNSIIKAKKFIDCCFENIDDVDIDSAIEGSNSESNIKEKVINSEQINTEIPSNDKVEIKEDLKEESNASNKVENDVLEKTINSNQPEGIDLDINKTKEEISIKESLIEESETVIPKKVKVSKEDGSSSMNDSKSTPNMNSTEENSHSESSKETKDVIQASDINSVVSESSVSGECKESLDSNENNTNQKLEELKLFD